MVVPKGSDVKDIIQNYDQVKEDIAEVGGETNPDAGTTTGGGGGGGGNPTPVNAAPKLTSVKYYIDTNNNGVSDESEMVPVDVVPTLGVANSYSVGIPLTETQIRSLTKVSFEIEEASDVTITANDTAFNILGYDFTNLNGTATLTPDGGKINLDLDVADVKAFVRDMVDTNTDSTLLTELEDLEGTQISIDKDLVVALRKSLSLTENTVNNTITLDVDLLQQLLEEIDPDLLASIPDVTNGSITVDVGEDIESLYKELSRILTNADVDEEKVLVNGTDVVTLVTGLNLPSEFTTTSKSFTLTMDDSVNTTTVNVSVTVTPDAEQ